MYFTASFFDGAYLCALSIHENLRLQQSHMINEYITSHE